MVKTSLIDLSHVPRPPNGITVLVVEIHVWFPDLVSKIVLSVLFSWVLIEQPIYLPSGEIVRERLVFDANTWRSSTSRDETRAKVPLPDQTVVIKAIDQAL